jgi:hypothetical protein
VADTGVVNLDADFVGTGRLDFDVLDRQVLPGLPSHRCLVQMRTVLVEPDAGHTLQVMVCKNRLSAFVPLVFNVREDGTLPTVSDGMANAVRLNVEAWRLF